MAAKQTEINGAKLGLFISERIKCPDTDCEGIGVVGDDNPLGIPDGTGGRTCGVCKGKGTVVIEREFEAAVDEWISASLSARSAAEVSGPYDRLGFKM